ncbi:hypothetical protein D3C87_1304480 [compost metagenome]
MIKIQETDELILTYDTDRGNNAWVYEKIQKERTFSLKSTFYFKSIDLLTKERDPAEPVIFRLAQKNEDGYYHIPKRILDVDFDLYLHSSLEISKKTFLTDYGSLSIFDSLTQFGLKDFFIGGNNPSALTENQFLEISKSIPNSYEVKKYVRARIDSVLTNYFQTGQNAENKFKKYLNKKNLTRGANLSKQLSEYEASKYKIILNKLEAMLSDENKYNEHQWQKEILEIVQLLYPKYIKAFEGTPINDPYSGKTRQLDFLLLDASGNIDIIEIKQPFDSSIVTQSQYRDNFIPLRELSGTVMQIEKYLFYLKSWAKKGEDILTEKYKNQLPKDFRIQITNPSGIIIMGREKGLSKEQLRDFEVIKRQYKNVVDIITYDDMLRRLKLIINSFESKT